MAISLANVKRGAQIRPPKIVVYGVGGVGKTTFAAGAPKPIFIFTEEGQGSLDVPRFELTPGNPVVQSWEQILECCSVLYNEDHDFETVVLDSIDFAEPLLWQRTAEKGGMDNIEGFGFGKGYIYAVDEARRLFDWLDALRRDRNMAIIIISHCDTVKFEDPLAESYDTYDLRLHKRLAAHLDYWSDAVLFANYRTHVVKDKEGFKKERKRGTGIGERVLYTQKRPGFRAKNRHGLPPEIDLSWQAFCDTITITNPEPKPAPPPQEED